MEILKRYPAYKYILAALDWATIVGAFSVALQFRGLWGMRQLSTGLTGVYPEILFIVLYGFLSLFIFQHYNLYKINVFITLVDHTVQLLKGVATVVIGLAVLSFFIRAPWMIDSRLAILYFAVICLAMFVALRVVVFRKLFLWLSKEKILQRNLLVVGAGATGRNLAVSVNFQNYGGHRVVGFLDDDLPLGKVVFEGAKVLGRVSELKECMKVFEADEIIICLERADYVRLMRVIEAATETKKTVKIASPLYEVIPARLFTEQYGSVPVVGVSQSSPSPLKEKYKRVFDVVLAVAGMIVLAPVFLVIAVLIKLDSKGPVFFRQTRIGKNGKAFTFFKFRSMTVGSEKDETRVHRATQFIRSKEKVNGENNGSTKIVNESRVTRVGKLLRKTSADELPQLINVLKGEMSLVGPRPCLPYEWDHYEEWHKRRLSVLPGCTGVWQVSARSAVGFEDMVVLDLYYIQNASLWFDFRLLLKTIPVMLFGVGAK